MSSLTHGTTTSANEIGNRAEVTNVSSHGLWLFTTAGELFLSYDDFPWFKDKIISQICHVQEPTPQHYYWPDLDIDIGLETIKEPKRFPLKAQ